MKRVSPSRATSAQAPLPAPRAERPRGELVPRNTLARLRKAAVGFEGGAISSAALTQFDAKQKFSANVTARQAMFESSAELLVSQAVAKIGALPDSAWRDGLLVERLICDLGVNDEMLMSMPLEFAECYGRGLHIWQYPNQLASYLGWLVGVAPRLRSYAEIGCRWGGTFILVAETLRRFAPRLEWVAAVDPIEQSPLLRAYEALLARRAPSVRFLYFRARSTEPSVEARLIGQAPSLVFIDGDHKRAPARHDHLLAEASGARYIVHHDVVSQACDSRVVWAELARAANRSGDGWRAREFAQQYRSVRGSWLGIGVLQRHRRNSSSLGARWRPQLEIHPRVLPAPPAPPI